MPTIDFDALRLPTPQEHIQNLEKSRERARLKMSDRAIFSAHFRKLISPVDCYTYFKARFGPPNGMINRYKSPSSDNLIHWHYTLFDGTHWIEILGFTTYVKIVVRGKEPWHAKDWLTFVDCLKQNFAKFGKEKSATLHDLEKWRVFVNPYRRLSTAVDSLAREIGKIISTSTPKLQHPLKKNDMKRWQAALNQKLILHNKLVQTGLSLKFLTPVLAESFVNLMIFLLAKPELKQDDRSYEATIRQQIDVRASMLAVYCNGFASPIDNKSEEFKAFKRIMDSRNDFLHGNVDPIKFGFEDVYFDQNIPLRKEGGDIFDLAQANSLRFIEPETIIEEVEHVRKFRDYVIRHLEPNIQREVLVALDSPELGLNLKTRGVGVLFPSHSVEVFSGPSAEGTVFFDD